MSLPAGVPVAPTISPPRAVDVAVARAVTRRHASTFALACRLLPRELRADVYVLYQVFRSLDDLVDERRADADARVAAVEAWAAGRPGPASEEVRLLDRLAARRPVDREALADFCAGMRRDLAGAGFATEADVDRYCYEVAGTVGVVMGGLLGAGPSPAAREAAAALGMAMQRTNILRDLDEDAAAGRGYVSAEMLERFGPPRPGRRGEFMRVQIAHADRLYERGLAGVPHLAAGRGAIVAAAQMYREILRELERRDGGERPGRAIVSGRRKVWVALGSLAGYRRLTRAR